MHEAHANLMNAYPNGTSIQHHHVVTSSITCTYNASLFMAMPIHIKTFCIHIM